MLAPIHSQSTRLPGSSCASTTMAVGAPTQFDLCKVERDFPRAAIINKKSNHVGLGAPNCWYFFR